jgi:hypothetical protein
MGRFLARVQHQDEDFGIGTAVEGVKVRDAASNSTAQTVDKLFDRRDMARTALPIAFFDNLRDRMPQFFIPILSIVPSNHSDEGWRLTQKRVPTCRS